jgi:uncharacterized protein (DUF1330 family)
MKIHHSRLAGAITLTTTAILSLGPTTLAATPPSAEHACLAPAAEGQSKLVALLSMKEGFGPSDHDGYEKRISPITLGHGMKRESAYTVGKYLGGAGPKQASTIGVWSLETPGSLQAVMGDSRYQAQVPFRDRLHDMANSVMYLAKEESTGKTDSSGKALLVGVIAMQPGFDYVDHSAYEKALAPITARHGMNLVRAYRVVQPLGGGPANAVAVNIWELPSPEALGKVMSDPEYVAMVPYRNRIHNMSETTMYFVASRKEN